MRIKPGVVIQKLLGINYVAYDNETSILHELNEVGYLILSEIEKGKTKKDIVGKIVEDFKVTAKKAARNYDEFLAVLRKKGLIVSKK